MTVTVLVPYRADSPERATAWSWLRTRWTTHHPDWQIVEATAPPGPWSKGAAIVAALPDITGEIVVVADADCWCDGTPTAVDQVTSGRARWAIPHRFVYRLTRAATTRAIAGVPLDQLDRDLSERPYLGHKGGGIVALRRDLLAEIPPDPRFVGWGHEDDAWALALTTLTGRPHRGVHPLYHLHHPPQPRRTRLRGSEASWELYRRYRQAHRNPDRMRQLVAEAHTPAAR